MVKNFTGRQTSFIPFRRTKPGIGAANHTTINSRHSTNRHLTQFAFGACSSGTLVHFSDPTYADHD
jgi:hypothetical protein